MSATPKSIALHIPADAAFLSVARMFGGSVAKTFGLDEGTAEDLRLALSEVCAAAAEHAERFDDLDGAHGLEIDVYCEPDALRFSCRPVSMLADDPRWGLISALLPDVRLNAPGGTLSFGIKR